ncbi:CDP-alcohol phosphatidyltransferase family protein [Myxococcota bacterium]|nr:CDP-alcohol phosphatidyltransferase family protein [Myxococcota bacterium]
MSSSRSQRLRSLIALPAHSSDWEFTSVLISRPLNFLLLHLVGDVAWITPNLVTLLGFASFLCASWLIAFHPVHLAAISLLLFARLILDDLDGMMARYRGGGSKLGSYLDKTTDVIGFFLFFSALGYRSAIALNQGWYPWIAHVATFSLLTTGYVKWVVHSFEPPESAQPEKPAATSIPKRPWYKIFAILLFLKLPALNECDIFPLAIILLLLGKPHWLLWVLATTQVFQMLAMVIIRGARAHALDRK